MEVVNMKRIALGMIMMAVSASAFSGDAENIAACAKKAKEFSGVILEEFDVNYEGNWLSMSIAKWSNAYCEVKIGEVYKLSINGELVIYDGFAGKGAYDLNKALKEKTDLTINKLNSRVSLLRQRMEKATEELRKPKPSHDELMRYIDEGVEKSICNSRGIDDKT